MRGLWGQPRVIRQVQLVHRPVRPWVIVFLPKAGLLPAFDRAEAAQDLRLTA